MESNRSLQSQVWRGRGFDPESADAIADAVENNRKRRATLQIKLDALEQSRVASAENSEGVIGVRRFYERIGLN